MRRHLFAGVLLAAALAGPSAAAPRCPFITDPAGDTGPPHDDALDLRSVDVASDGRVLTMAARVTSLRLPPATSPTRVRYSFQFQAGEVHFLAHARFSSLEGEAFSLHRASGHVGENGAWGSTRLESTVHGRFDQAAGTVTVHVPVADLNKVVRVSPGDYVYEIGAITWRTAGLGDVYAFADADFADSDRSYQLGARGCIAPGR